MIIGCFFEEWNRNSQLCIEKPVQKQKYNTNKWETNYRHFQVMMPRHALSNIICKLALTDQTYTQAIKPLLLMSGATDAVQTKEWMNRSSKLPMYKPNLTSNK
jgi:hypothetical protein